jgi:uncharacterized protein (UPF0264 family)
VKVLVSVVSAAEAIACCDGEADIVDIKNVSEGSLGASFPWTVREIVESVQRRHAVISAALGDLTFQPGTASLAAAGLTATGVDFVKAGLYGVRNVDEGVTLMKAVARACRDANASVKVVAAGYADYRRFGGLDLSGVLQAALESDSDYVMLDTAIKDGKSLFDALALSEIAEFVGSARRARLGVALAGSLRLADLSALSKLSPDIIGVRGAVCDGKDRTAQMDAAAVQQFVSAVHELCLHA